MFHGQNHWRNSARPVRFFGIDARAGVFLFLFMLHVRMWTFVTLILVCIFFTILERFGLTFTTSLRRIRLFFIGHYRPALSKFYQRPFIDRGGE